MLIRLRFASWHSEIPFLSRATPACVCQGWAPARREGVVRQMLEAGARRAESLLLEYYQGMVELLPTSQYGRQVSLTHPDDAAWPETQPPIPPVPYAVYLQQWDGGGRAEGG